MQMDVHKPLYPFYNTKKMPRVMATVAKMRFVGSDSQLYYDNFTIGYLQIFKQGTSFHRSIAIMTNETTNYNFILPSKTCQRHLETRAVILSKAITHFIKP